MFFCILSQLTQSCNMFWFHYHPPFEILIVPYAVHCVDDCFFVFLYARRRRVVLCRTYRPSVRLSGH